MEWKGIFPAVTTKFKSDDSLDIDLFSINIKEQLKAGVHGIILGGTLGESSVLEEFEKEQLVYTCLELVNGQIPIVLNIAEGSTKSAVRQASLAKEWGASGLMLLPPMRYKADELETFEYFTAIAKSTDLPIMIYNNPVDYKIEVPVEMFDKLLEFNNIQAIKESTRDVTNVIRLKRLYADRLKVLCGVDTLAMESLILGADGWVAGLVCAFPHETVSLYYLMQEGRIEEALQLYKWFIPLLELDIHPKLVQYIKLCEAKVGLGSEYVRPPRLSLKGSERMKVISIIENALASRPQS